MNPKNKLSTAEKPMNSDRDRNREQFPEIASFVDLMREVFGEVKVVKILGRRKA